MLKSHGLSPKPLFFVKRTPSFSLGDNDETWSHATCFGRISIRRTNFGSAEHWFAWEMGDVRSPQFSTFEEARIAAQTWFDTMVESSVQELGHRKDY